MPNWQVPNWEIHNINGVFTLYNVMLILRKASNCLVFDPAVEVLSSFDEYRMDSILLVILLQWTGLCLSNKWAVAYCSTWSSDESHVKVASTISTATWVLHGWGKLVTGGVSFIANTDCEVNNGFNYLNYFLNLFLGHLILSNIYLQRIWFSHVVTKRISRVQRYKY